MQSRRRSDWYFAEYSTFRVLTEADNFTLQVAGYSGNAGDALTHQNGMMFTTFDRDNDLLSTVNCAAWSGGGFWHRDCFHCGVNAVRSNYDVDFKWRGLRDGSALQSSRMWLQCK